MKKKIAVGMLLVLAIALALGFAQLYSGASEAVEVECEEYGGEASDRPSVSAEVYSPNETEDENTTWIKSEIEKFKKV